eukprot:CAMPEP_0194272934 /NCGR_PEP_ID=MMETSP0169-20130528/6381_1 /TAXON_ID=218684 /ORGANISM="Corethron pennatum, Strain L29A3" /LENGTH=429 /DNA_ID=CAMNT_0039015729 /DNA_START=214 /DNA_END=1503 /DNA_ORIENTATION=-
MNLDGVDDGRDAPGGRVFGRKRITERSKLRSVTMPLLDVSIPLKDFGLLAAAAAASEEGDTINVVPTSMTPSNTLTPLPSSHLPLEVSSLNVYGIELKSPSHIRMMQEAERLGIYGHLVHREVESELVGAIGCAADIVRCSYQSDSNKKDKNDGFTSVAALMRGSFRFVVKEVISTFPFPVVLVDELLDDVYGSNDVAPLAIEDDDDNDGDGDGEYDYGSIPADELPARTLAAMDAIVKMKVDVPNKSPLENVILESQGIESPSKGEAEELAALFDVFRMELVEITDRTLRCFAIGVMATEVAELSYDQRRDVLVMTDGAARLRIVLQLMESRISMEWAKKMVQQVTAPEDEAKNLKVGKPCMPPWLKSIQEGTRLEYFWSEEEGWCSGRVLEKLILGDEVLLKINFDDDGSVHRIPFTAEEKIRWRPL